MAFHVCPTCGAVVIRVTVDGVEVKLKDVEKTLDMLVFDEKLRENKLFDA